jgi:hypothetical protein
MHKHATANPKMSDRTIAADTTVPAAAEQQQREIWYHHQQQEMSPFAPADASATGAERTSLGQYGPKDVPKGGTVGSYWVL